MVVKQKKYKPVRSLFIQISWSNAEMENQPIDWQNSSFSYNVSQHIKTKVKNNRKVYQGIALKRLLKMYFMLAILSKNKTKLVLLTQTVRFCSVNLTCYRGLAKDGTRGDSALEKNKRARQELKSQARREITTSKQTVSKCNVKIMVKSSFFFSLSCNRLLFSVSTSRSCTV